MRPRNKSLLLYFFIFFYGYSINAQTYECEWDKKIAELTNNGIDTLLFYVPYQGNLWPAPIDTCMYIYPKYLIWKEKNTVRVQKFVDCFNTKAASMTGLTSETVFMDSCKPFAFMLTCFTSILPEIMLPGEIKIRINNVDTCYLIKSSHPGYTGIDVYLKGRLFEKGFTYDSFDDGIEYKEDNSIRAVQESVNYKYNMATYVYQLSLLLKDFIKKLEAETKFIYRPERK